MAGEIVHFAGASAPVGWLKCNGAAVSRSTYAVLFAALGTQYGAGDGTTTFNLPDYRGEFLRGLDDGRGVDAGRALGTAQTDALQNITGNFGVYSSTSNAGATGAFSGSMSSTALSGGASVYSVSVGIDASRVARTAAETRPRNVAALVLIKY
nr:tail fiber protein [Aquitalea magnusonii]